MTTQVVIQKTTKKTFKISIEKKYILVKAPAWASEEQINSFIFENKTWIQKHLHLTKEKEFSFLGITGWNFSVNNEQQFSFDEKTKIISIHENILHNNKEIFIKRIYTNYLISHVKQFNEISLNSINVKPKNWNINSLSNAWGQCNHLKIITLDPLIAALPIHLQNYVISHEIGHLIHLNHSKDFWAICDQIYPGARRADKELKNYCKNNFL